MAENYDIATTRPADYNNEQPVVSTLPPSAFMGGTMPPSAYNNDGEVGTYGAMSMGMPPSTLQPSAYMNPMQSAYSAGKGKGKGAWTQMDNSIPGGAVTTLPPSAFLPPPSGNGTPGYPSMGMGGPPQSFQPVQEQFSKGMTSKGMGKGAYSVEGAYTPQWGGPSMGGVPPTMEPSAFAEPPGTMAPSQVQERDMIPEEGGDADAASQMIMDKDQDDYKKWHNIRQFTAYMFTLTAFTILAAPTIISIQLGMDVDASFWIGRWGLIALFVPVFLLGQHFYHLWMINNRRERRRYIFFLVPVFPAALFMVIGGTYMSFARNLYGQLKSDDCSLTGPTPSKYYMQEAYNEARGAYDQCLSRLQADNLGAPLRRHPNLQSCLEWDELIQHEDKRLVPWKGYKVQPGTLRQYNPSNLHRWQYLANVEINHVCGGFCKPGPSLFVSFDHSGRQGGSCSQFVAFRFLSIHHWGTVVFTIGLLIVLITVPVYVMSRGFLNTMGYKSAAVIA